MKKIFCLWALMLLTACYKDYIHDYDYNAVYFSQQINVRTFVVGEGMQVKAGVVLGGVRDNDRDRTVEFSLNNGLFDTDDIFQSMKSGADHIKNNLSDAIVPIPSDYYTLSDHSKMVIKSGEHKGVITIKADSAKFLADAKTLKAYYALPLYITGADADSILEGKQYSVIGLRYENMLFGNYWHGGETIVKDAAGNVVKTIKYYTAIPSPEAKIMNLKTVGPHTLVSNKISDEAGSFKITLQGDHIEISGADGSKVQVSPDGECKFNRAKLLQDRKIFLKYKYNNEDGTTSHATDTLTFRNRIRDGVNEWQDENPENYQ
jgi:hypothetical protein